jgi:hypothetical protein
VELPDQAVITDIIFNLVGSSAGFNGRIGFHAKSLDSNTWTELNTFSFGSVLGSFQVSTGPLGPGGSPVVINNNDASFYVRLFNGSNSSSDTLGVTGIRVRYTFGPNTGIRGA